MRRIPELSPAWTRFSKDGYEAAIRNRLFVFFFTHEFNSKNVRLFAKEMLTAIKLLDNEPVECRDVRYAEAVAYAMCAELLFPTYLTFKNLIHCTPVLYADFLEFIKLTETLAVLPHRLISSTIREYNETVHKAEQRCITTYSGNEITEQSVYKEDGSFSDFHVRLMGGITIPFSFKPIPPTQPIMTKRDRMKLHKSVIADGTVNPMQAFQEKAEREIHNTQDPRSQK